jgi:hypothetical protein
MSIDSSSRREILKASRIAAPGGVIDECTAATGINSAVPPAAKLIDVSTFL